MPPGTSARTQSCWPPWRRVLCDWRLAVYGPLADGLMVDDTVRVLSLRSSACQGGAACSGTRSHGLLVDGGRTTRCSFWKAAAAHPVLPLDVQKIVIIGGGAAVSRLRNAASPAMGRHRDAERRRRPRYRPNLSGMPGQQCGGGSRCATVLHKPASVRLKTYVRHRRRVPPAPAVAADHLRPAGSRPAPSRPIATPGMDLRNVCAHLW